MGNELLGGAVGGRQGRFAACFAVGRPEGGGGWHQDGGLGKSGGSWQAKLLDRMLESKMELELPEEPLEGGRAGTLVVSLLNGGDRGRRWLHANVVWERVSGIRC